MKPRHTVFRTEWFDIEEEWFDGVAALAGKPHYRINSPDGVLIVALTERHEVILVKQFRPAIRRSTLELPSGAVDAGETALQAAARELYEETGYTCSSLVEIGPGRLMANRHACREFGFFGTGAVRHAGFRPRDDIEVMTVPVEEFRALVVSGTFEQLAALGIVLLLEWKLGRRLADAGAAGSRA